MDATHIARHGAGTPTNDGQTDMTAIFGSHLDAAERKPTSDGDERNIRAALRMTMLFVAIVLLLAWAGLAEAGAMTDSAVRAACPAAPSSSPTLR